MTTQIVFENGKWVGLANGVKVVKSYDQTRVVKMMAKAGYRNVAIKGEDVTAEVEEDTQSQWDINTRFDFVTQLVDMVARNKAVSLIVTGPGGLGKTHTVRAALETAGLKDASGFDAETAEGSFKMKSNGDASINVMILDALLIIDFLFPHAIVEARKPEISTSSFRVN